MKGFIAILLLLFHAVAALASAGVAGEEVVAYESKKFALGVGLGIVKFDTNVKVTSKETGNSHYVDLEGNLGLSDSDQVNTIYGAYRFNEKHSLVFGYYAIERDASLLDFSGNFNDIIVVKADVSFEDSSHFLQPRVWLQSVC